MNEQAFLEGVGDLLKTSALADYIGRFLSQTQVPKASQADHAGINSFINMPLSVAGLSPVGEMAAAHRTAKPGKELEDEYQKSVERVIHDNTLKNMLYTGFQSIGPGAVAGGLLGGAAGGLGIGPALAPVNQDSVSGRLVAALIGAGAGGMAGAAGGALGGAGSGLIQSAVLKNVSKDNRDKAIKMKAEHPYITALPFGNLISAGLA